MKLWEIYAWYGGWTAAAVAGGARWWWLRRRAARQLSAEEQQRIRDYLNAWDAALDKRVEITLLELLYAAECAEDPW